MPNGIAQFPEPLDGGILDNEFAPCHAKPVIFHTFFNEQAMTIPSFWQLGLTFERSRPIEILDYLPCVEGVTKPSAWAA